MKKLVIILVIIIAAVGAYFLFSGDNRGVSLGDNKSVEPQETDPELLDRLQDVQVTASEDGSKVTLSGGKGEFSVDGGKKGEVVLGKIASEYTFETRKDVLAIFSIGGGSVASEYLVLFEDKGGVLTEKSIALLGEVDVRSIVTTGLGSDRDEEYVATVTALVDDAGVTVQKTYIFTVEGGVFNLAKSFEI